MQKNKQYLYRLCGTALFTAISIVVSRFSIMIPLFGYPSVRFSVTSIPIFLVGSLFGPVYGACAGFIGDITGYILSGGSMGAYHPGFTINSILIGLIPGFLFHYCRQHRLNKSLNGMNTMLAILALAGAMVYVNFIGIGDVAHLGKVMGVPINQFLTMVLIVLMGVFVFVVWQLQKRLEKKEQFFKVDRIIFATILSYIVVQLMCTPIWVNHLYNVPITASIFVRVFKAIVDVPLQVGLLVIIFSALPAQVKGVFVVCKDH